MISSFIWMKSISSANLDKRNNNTTFRGVVGCMSMSSQAYFSYSNNEKPGNVTYIGKETFIGNYTGRELYISIKGKKIVKVPANAIPSYKQAEKYPTGVIGTLVIYTRSMCRDTHATIVDDGDVDMNVLSLNERINLTLHREILTGRSPYTYEKYEYPISQDHKRKIELMNKIGINDLFNAIVITPTNFDRNSFQYISDKGMIISHHYDAMMEQHRSYNKFKADRKRKPVEFYIRARTEEVPNCYINVSGRHAVKLEYAYANVDEPEIYVKYGEKFAITTYAKAILGDKETGICVYSTMDEAIVDANKPLTPEQEARLKLSESKLKLRETEYNNKKIEDVTNKNFRFIDFVGSHGKTILTVTASLVTLTGVAVAWLAPAATALSAVAITASSLIKATSSVAKIAASVVSGVSSVVSSIAKVGCFLSNLFT